MGRIGRIGPIRPIATHRVQKSREKNGPRSSVPETVEGLGMANFTVDPTLEQGVVVLEVKYQDSALFKDSSYEELSLELQKLDQKVRKDRSQDIKTPSCIIRILSRSAGTVLIRALFDHWQVVSANGGRLVCTDYPKAYLPSLRVLGLNKLPGFHLADSLNDAVQLALTGNAS